MRAAPRLMATLLLVGLLAVTGCTRFTGQVTVHADDSISMRYEISVADDPSQAEAAKKLRDDCTDSRRVGQFFKASKKLTTEQGRLVCRITGDVNQRRLGSVGVSIHHEDGKQHFSFAEGALETIDPEASKNVLAVSGVEQFELKVSFRGQVVSHSGSSTVEGRTVTWRDPNDLKTGISAVAQEPGLFDRTIGEWIAIGVGLTGLLAYAAWVIADIVRRRRVEHRAPWGGPTHQRR